MLNDDDVFHLARLALTKDEADVRLFLAKQVRKLRRDDPESATRLEGLLKSQSSRSTGILRDAFPHDPSDRRSNLDSTPSLLKHYDNDQPLQAPIWEGEVLQMLGQIISERHFIDELSRSGLLPTRSLIFEGPPGVGKTMSAKWLAKKLALPLYALDLSAVMSSYLGKTGSNLRSVFDFAKSHPCVLLLDEVDAIAKRRADDADVGELKRLVTVMLQELDDWPADGLLIAATNHGSLVDPALWRRFEMVVAFKAPSAEMVRESICRYMGPDFDNMRHWAGLLEYLMVGKSHSDIERVVMQLRRLKVISPLQFEDLAANLLIRDVDDIKKSERINAATYLVSTLGFSQHQANKMTGVSRDTIRKKIA